MTTFTECFKKDVRESEAWDHIESVRNNGRQDRDLLVYANALREIAEELDKEAQAAKDKYEIYYVDPTEMQISKSNANNGVRTFAEASAKVEELNKEEEAYVKSGNNLVYFVKKVS